MGHSSPIWNKELFVLEQLSLQYESGFLASHYRRVEGTQCTEQLDASILMQTAPQNPLFQMNYCQLVAIHIGNETKPVSPELEHIGAKI